MSLSNQAEAENNIKRRGKKHYFEREKSKISEVIPSLLLVTDDVISPINVVFDATNKLFSGETFNEKNSPEELFLNEDQVANSLPTKTVNCPEMSKVESSEEMSESKSALNLFGNKFSSSLIRHSLDRRRKSDCPARHKARAKLDQSGGGVGRVKSKSIERAVDIELSSHLTPRSAANQKLNIGNLILNLSGELLVHQAPGQGEIKFSQSKIHHQGFIKKSIFIQMLN